MALHHSLKLTLFQPKGIGSEVAFTARAAGKASSAQGCLAIWPFSVVCLAVQTESLLSRRLLDLKLGYGVRVSSLQQTDEWMEIT
jgi:hypothetical protein